MAMIEIRDEKHFEDLYNTKPGLALGLMFEQLRCQQAVCLSRPVECAKRFVQVRHVAFGVVAIMGLLVGMGYVQVSIFLPAMIKAAVAAAIVTAP